MLRLMIVDDEVRIADSIYDLMQEHFDLELYRCYSALDALEIIRTMRFDIVITDISMPGMNGLELLSRTQAIWPKCHFLILTAYDSFDYAYETLRHDRVDYLLKIESWETICACVEKKLAIIRAEREKEEQLQHYGQYMQQVGASISRYLLKRIIQNGIPLPEQKDVDALPVPIRLNQPVVLALLAMGDQNPLINNGESLDIMSSVETRLKTYGLQAPPYLSSGIIVLAIQSAQSGALAGNLSTYVQTALETLPQCVEDATGQQLAILCADQPVAWSQIHALYLRAAVALENIRSSSGMVLLSVEEELRRSVQELSFPSMEETGMLWEMIRGGNVESLGKMLRERLQSVASPTALPQRTISALGYLILEADRFYAVRDDARSAHLADCKAFDSVESWISALCQYISDIRISREESWKSRDAWLIVRVNQYIEQHYHEELTLTLLAEEMHYNPAYLSRFYKANTGVNLMTHLYNVRIQKARELLLGCNDKVSDIARKTGFCSTKYFNRVFKKVVGVSPSQFRRESVGGTDAPGT